MQFKAWKKIGVSLLAVVLIAPWKLSAEDVSKLVLKTVESSTLDQPGTHPFHLKASYAPSQERDRGTNRTGAIEIWWESPNHWRREVRSPEFHQIAVADGVREWQKNEGDYFPDWLRELADAIVRPMPLPTDILKERVQTGEVRRLSSQTNVNWDADNSPRAAQWNQQCKGKGYVALYEKTGLLFYTGGPGFGGLYDSFIDFHGRKIATKVAAGYIEVTAKVSVLEDLGPTPSNFFDVNAPGGDPQPITTAILSEADLRENLQSKDSFHWPALSDGPLEGVVWTEVVLDRTGKIREMIKPVSDNPGLQEAAEQGFRAMRFKPILINGIPAQATGRVSVHFKTVRPAGMEAFDSAHNYFEKGRQVSSLGAGATAPYLLRAEFQTATPGGIQTGRYEDTWVSASEWKREAWFGTSHLVRSQVGEKHYLLSDGPEAGILRLVMLLVEPIPASDTMTESDWRIRRDTAVGVKAIRVFRGPEGPNGELEAGKSQGYWFDSTGHLVKSYTMGFEFRPLEAQAYGGVDMPRRFDVLKDIEVGLRLTVKEIGPVDPAVAKAFILKNHEWKRAFTAEVR